MALFLLGCGLNMKCPVKSRRLGYLDHLQLVLRGCIKAEKLNIAERNITL